MAYGGAWNYPGTLAAYNRYRSNDGTLDNYAVDGLFTSNHDLVRPINKVLGQLTASGDINGRGTITSSNSQKANEMALTTMAAVILLPGLSWIYYGDELGMSGNLPSGTSEQSPHADRFSRQPFKWDQAGTNQYTTGYTFSGDKTYSVEWDNYNLTLPGVHEQIANGESMLSMVKYLTEIKKNHDAFKIGDYVPLPVSGYSENYNVFAFARSYEGQTYKVYINMSNQTTSLSGLTGSVLLTLKGATMTSLAPWSILVVN